MKAFSGTKIIAKTWSQLNFVLIYRWTIHVLSTQAESKYKPATLNNNHTE